MTRYLQAWYTFDIRKNNLRLLIVEGVCVVVHRRKNKNSKGQNLIEYAIVIAVVAAAMAAMSTYVFRAVQATQQTIQRGY